MHTVRADDLRQLLSPAFFRVFSTTKIARAVRELVGNYRDEMAFRRAVDRRRTAMREADIPVELECTLGPGEETVVEDGDQVLAIYFHQLFDDVPTLLDLRRDRFVRRNETLTWAPRPIYIDWEEPFIDGVRAMYRGFFGDRDAEFQRGLAMLNLHGMGDVFLAHFGGGDQRAVHFEIDHFHSTFADILERAEAQERSLHHQFAALGVYLATLYDHLEQLGGTYDARSAALTQIAH